jgi:hypothetical protein
MCPLHFEPTFVFLFNVGVHHHLSILRLWATSGCHRSTHFHALPGAVIRAGFPDTVAIDAPPF